MKIKIGYKAKNKNGDWWLYEREPLQCIDCWGFDRYYELKAHPEQPEINWKDSLEEAYITV